MRISDWSSDVCSSDLDGAELAQQAGVEGDLVHPIEDLTRRLRRAPAEDRIDLHDDDVVRLRRIEEGKESGVTHVAAVPVGHAVDRSEEHTSELQSLMRISYAVFCLKKTNNE